MRLNTANSILASNEETFKTSCNFRKKKSVRALFGLYRGSKKHILGSLLKATFADGNNACIERMQTYLLRPYFPGDLFACILFYKIKLD